MRRPNRIQHTLARTGAAASALAGLIATSALAQPANRLLPSGTRTPSAPAGQPATTPATTPAQPGGTLEPTVEGDDVTFPASPEPIELSLLVEIVQQVLEINVATKDTLQGKTIAFNAPLKVKKDRLLAVLDSFLDLHGFTISQDAVTGIWVIVPSNEVGVGLGETAPTTRVFDVPGVRPSALRSAIEPMFSGRSGGGAPQGEQAGQPGRASSTLAEGGLRIAYMDELGVIVATGTPRNLDRLDQLLTRLLDEFRRFEFRRFDLKYIAAPTARERILLLVGLSVQRNNPLDVIYGGGRGGGGGEQPSQVARTPSLDNVAERLTADPQANALVFRGRQEEIAIVTKLVELIDSPGNLIPKRYQAGPSAQSIADIAKNRGLGEVITIQSTPDRPDYNFGGISRDQVREFSRSAPSGGAVMVVDVKTGAIIFYGTEEQHIQLARLVETLDLVAEAIVTRAYALKHNKAEEVAQIILGLIQNQTPAGESPLIPGESGASFNRQPTYTPPSGPVYDEQGNLISGVSVGDQAFIIADKANNQVLVKAPLNQHPEFEKLIGKLDQRRPQVYIEAKILAVTTDDQFRLAVESQLIFGDYVQNTNFGLGSFAEGANLNGSKLVNTALSGLTSALIMTDQVPFIINAFKQNTDAEILSSPQLLVDDNATATVVSLDEQPVATISRGTGGQGDIVTSGESAEAGTTLEVTPQISESNYLRLDFSIELSSFTGEAQQGLAPPKQTNNLDASVTVPSDMTVVVGGIVVDTTRHTVAKIPLLGDIPLIKHLFRDNQKSSRKTVLYVFLTPRILKDPNFNDLMLLTKGPMAAVELSPNLPPIRPELIDIVLPASAPLAPPSQPATRPEDAPVIEPRENGKPG